MNAPRAPEPTIVVNSSRSSARRGWAALAVFALLAVLALAGATAFCRALPAPEPTPFDERALDQLKRVRPAFVLLGNSMVGTRFDEQTLRRSLRTSRVSVIGVNGSKSAVWYLILKNLVVASRAHPRLVLFFRGEELTQPRDRTTGAGYSLIQRFSVGSEPLVEHKIAPPWSAPIARLAWYRTHLMPFERFHTRTEPIIDRFGSFFLSLFQHGAEPPDRRRQINDLFALSNLRAAEVIQDQIDADEHHLFKDEVEASFLPDICQLAGANQIPLTFVRVRTRVAASGSLDSSSERRYVADLAGYLRGCAAEFYDMHDAAWESIDLYGNGDHIAGRYKRAYSRMFVEHLGEIFH